MKATRFASILLCMMLGVFCCMGIAACGPQDDGPTKVVKSTVDAVNAGDLDAVMANLDDTSQAAVKASSFLAEFALDKLTDTQEDAGKAVEAASFAASLLGFASEDIDIPEDIVSASVSVVSANQRIDGDKATVDCKLKMELVAASNPISFEVDQTFKAVKGANGEWKLTLIPEIPNLDLSALSFLKDLDLSF